MGEAEGNHRWHCIPLFSYNHVLGKCLIPRDLSVESGKYAKNKNRGPGVWEGCLFPRHGTDQLDIFLHIFHHAFFKESPNAKGGAEIHRKRIYSTVWILHGKFSAITTLVIHHEIKNSGHLCITEITLKHLLPCFWVKMLT